MHNEITAGQLANALNRLKAAIERFTYDTVHDPRISLSTDASGEAYITASIYVYDDFQSDLEWNKRVQNGSMSFSLSDDGSHFVIPSSFMSREQRELSVMVGQLGTTKELLTKMQSAAAQEFLDRITAELHQYELLAAPKF